LQEHPGILNICSKPCLYTLLPCLCHLGARLVVFWRQPWRLCQALACTRGPVTGKHAPAELVRNALFGRSPHRTCKNDFDCRIWRELKSFSISKQRADSTRQALLTASLSGVD
jgi:hypothetical protein